MKDLSNLTIILTPVYEDLESLSLLINKIDNLYENIFFIIVDDCSVENKITLDTLSFGNSSGEIINLEKNLGHQGAICFGLNYINLNYGNYTNIVIMDSDGEDTPESISLLKKEIESNDINLVVATRKTRQNSISFKSFYYVYKIFFYYLVGYKLDFGNYMIMNRKGLLELLSVKDLNIHIAGSVIKSEIKYSSLKIDRGQRYKGESRMNFFSLVLHGLRALIVLNALVTRRAFFYIPLLLYGCFFVSNIFIYILILHCIFYFFLALYKNNLKTN
tara:strand:+ start:3032 stop:3856 length:825 start_codon:yes stop_codon:yes gene_type:complete